MKACPTLFTLATITVSWIWFLGLAFAGSKIGAADTGGRWIQIINKISAILIWAVAVYIAFKLFSFQ